jgi:hypothetical protein
LCADLKKNVYVLPFGKRLSFCLKGFEKNAYLLPFTYTSDVREKKFLFSDAWAIAEAYVGCMLYKNKAAPCIMLYKKMDTLNWTKVI